MVVGHELFLVSSKLDPLFNAFFKFGNKCIELFLLQIRKPAQRMDFVNPIDLEIVSKGNLDRRSASL